MANFTKSEESQLEKMQEQFQDRKWCPETDAEGDLGVWRVYMCQNRRREEQGSWMLLGRY